MVLVPNVQLHNGVEMPQLGLGVWQAREGQEVEGAVGVALESGYRLIDTAAVYENERGVGRALAASGIPREDLFITTKVWNGDQGYDSTLRAFDASLEKLQIDYLDLYLIHWPMPEVGSFVDTWRALERLYADRRVRAIGVSNFREKDIQRLIDEDLSAPMVNQVELHPLLTQQPLRQYCDTYDIRVESWSPLMRGGEVLSHPTVTGIAERHGKTPAQTVLRWHIQNGLIAIPKSVTPERIRENIDIFDFDLSAEDMALIDDLNRDVRIGPDPAAFNG